MKLDINKVSSTYNVRLLTIDDVEACYELCMGNPLYYEYHPPIITKEGIIEDMSALPPSIQMDQKYYIGFFDQETLVAIMDIIDGYPKPTCLYIGFFMMAKGYQGKQMGTTLIHEFISYAKSLSFYDIQLGYMKENKQSEHFWLKQGFNAIGEKAIDEGIVIKCNIYYKRANVCSFFLFNSKFL